MRGSDRWNAAPTTLSGADRGLATKCVHVLLNTLRSLPWPSRLYMATKFTEGWPSTSTCAEARQIGANCWLQPGRRHAWQEAHIWYTQFLAIQAQHSST